MRREDKLLILSTFIVGMAIGMYAYFAGFAPVTKSVTETVSEWSDTLTIIGEAYGGCDMANMCPSFYIDTDGGYRYFYHPNGVAEAVLREGTVSRSLLRELQQNATQAELQVSSRPTDPAYCDSYVDGIDVRYTVTLNDQEYVLDSCGTDVNSDGPLWKSLSNIWDFFETVS